MKSGKADFGYLWQGKQAEVLVCDLVEIIALQQRRDPGARRQVRRGSNDDKAVEAVQFLYDTINKPRSARPTC